MNIPPEVEYFIEKGIYKVGDKWYANIFCPLTGKKSDEFEGKITAREQYDDACNFGVNDGMAYAMKIAKKGNKLGLFAFHCFASHFTGCYVCHDPDVYVYDEVQAFCDWENWEDWGYALCRQGDLWKAIKVTQFPYSGYDIIASGVTRDEALAAIDLTDLSGFMIYDDGICKTWEKHYTPNLENLDYQD